MGRSKDLASGAAYQDQTESDTRYVNTAGDTMTGTLVAGTRLQVGDSSITQGYPQANFGYVADFQAATGSQTFISIAPPSVSSLGDNGTVIGEDGSDTYITQRGNKNIKLGTSNVNRLIIDGSGRVTTPNQPMFGAYNYSGTATAIGGYNPMRWANVHTNVGNHFNNSTGKFTFPVSGKYVVFCNINHKAADANWSGLYMLYNTSVQMVSWSMNTAATEHDNVIISSLVSASANDTLAFCWHNSYTAPSTNASYNMAYIYLLG